VYDMMNDEFQELMKKFGSERRSKIETEEGVGELLDIDLIRNSRSVIVVLRSGYIKRMPLKTFESQNRGTRGKRGTSLDSSTSADNDVLHCFTCNDHDTLLMVTQSGIAYGIRAFQVPSGGRTARGQPIPSVLPLRSDDTVTAILPVSEFSKEEYLVLATRNGWIKRTPLKAFDNMTTRGLTIASLADGDRLKWCHRCGESDSILIGSTKGMATRFEASKLRPTGRTSRGVRAMKLRDGDQIADMNVLSADDDSKNKEFLLAITSRGFGKRVAASEFNIKARGGIGNIAIKFKKSKGETEDTVSCLLVAHEDDEVLVITSKGIMVRQKVSAIPVQSRTATGVMIQRLDDGDEISSVSIVPKTEQTD